MASALDDFLAYALSKLDCPYVWPCEENNYSGRDLPGAKYKNVYDCTGLVVCSLYKASKKKLDWRPDHNAQKVFDECKPMLNEKQRPCLALYGHGKNMITHVMIALPDGRAFGACGGGSDTITPELAKKAGARVRFRPSVNYREDFISFRAIPL